MGSSIGKKSFSPKAIKKSTIACLAKLFGSQNKPIKRNQEQ